MAEQVTVKRLTIHVTNKGERVLWDPAMTISRVYMYFYCMINSEHFLLGSSSLQWGFVLTRNDLLRLVGAVVGKIHIGANF